MIIFWRWRQINKDIWPTYNLKCEHCNNESFFYIKRISTRFTLFFIPIFPYEWYYFLYCPTCEHWIKLSYSKAENLVDIAKLNNRFVNKEITKDDYLREIYYLENKDNLDKDNDLSIESSEYKSCPLCWKEIKVGAKKCKHCKKRIK